MSGARGTPAALAAMLIAAGGLALQAAPEPRPERRLPVRLCDEVHAPSAVTAASIAISTSVYARAGITLDWMSSCAPGGLVVTLIAESDVPRRFTSDTVGFAEPGTTEASVIYERVDRLAHKVGARRALLLGYVIAHELGHLLLPPHSHSESGVMTATFNPQLLDQGPLKFEPEQAALLRAAIADYAPRLAGGTMPFNLR